MRAPYGRCPQRRRAGSRYFGVSPCFIFDGSSGSDITFDGSVVSLNPGCLRGSGLLFPQAPIASTKHSPRTQQSTRLTTV